MNLQPNETPTDTCLAECDLQNAPKILCIDDDPDIIRSFETVLSNFEIQLLTADCGALGIIDVFDEQPDVIITDVRMPNGDGPGLIKRIKSNTVTARIPVIVFTGRRDARLPDRMKRLGAAGFLHKPAHFEALLSEIGKFVPLTERNWADDDLTTACHCTHN